MVEQFPFDKRALRVALALIVLGAAPAVASAGYVAPADGLLYASEDAQEWHPVGMGIAGAYAVASNGTAWVAVAFQGPIFDSDDGVVWNATPSPVESRLWSVAASQNMWVAVGTGGTIISRTGNAAWTTAVSGTTHTLRAVAHGPAGWLAVGDAGTILHSSDGLLWTPRAPGATSVTLFAVVGLGDGWVVAAGSNVLHSRDGLLWWPQDIRVPGPISALAQGEGTVVALGWGGTVARSADGARWQAMPAVSGARFMSVAHDGASFVAVGDQGSVFRSPDGTNWTETNTGLSGMFTGIATGPVTFPEAAPSAEAPQNSNPNPTEGPAGQGGDAALDCTPRKQEIFVGHAAPVNAIGGTPPYAWDIPAGASWSDESMEVQFSEPGDYVLKVTDSATPPAAARCRVHVIDPPGQQAQPTPSEPNEPAGEQADGAQPCEPLSACAQSRQDLAPLPAPPAHPVGAAATIKPEDPIPVELAVGGAMALVLLLLLLLRRRLAFAALCLFSRLRTERLLQQPLRKELFEVIKARPGIHLRELMRAVGRQVGVVNHHLQVLERGGLVYAQGTLRQRHYFAREIIDPAMVRAHAALWSQTGREILEMVARHPGITVRHLAQIRKTRYATVQVHVYRLRRAGLMAAQMEGRLMHLHTTPLAARFVGAAGLDANVDSACPVNSGTADARA